MNPGDIKTEIQIFHNYIKKITETIDDKNLKNLLTSISYQFSIETIRVYLQELKEILCKKAPQHFRGKIENSHDIISLKQLEFDKIKDKIHNFNIFLETTARHLSNRAIFPGQPIDENRAEKILKQYL